jgi:hypothetical protein
MAETLDAGMTLLAKLIARRGRSRLYLAVLLLLCGFALIAYWNTPVRENAFAEREKMIHLVIGVIGSLLAAISAWRIVGAVREAFSPTTHPLFASMARGELKAIVEDVGAASTINLASGDLFEVVNANRDDRATLVAYLRQRFPQAKFEQIVTIVKRY